MSDDKSRSLVAYARVAGLMYLLGDTMLELGNVLTSNIAGTGTSIDIAHRIATSQSLYRLGLACHVVTTLSLIWLAVSFYSILKPVSPFLALIAMLSWIAEASVSALINIFDFLGLRIALSAASAPVAERLQLAKLGDFTDHASGTAFTLGIIVFSMGSILFYLLFLRSRYLPRMIAGFDLAASVLVMVIGFIRLLNPSLSGVASYGFIPMSIAEFGTGIWLLIMGVRNSARWDTTDRSAALA